MGNCVKLREEAGEPLQSPAFCQTMFLMTQLAPFKQVRARNVQDIWEIEEAHFANLMCKGSR